jgi:short-subunit dehydrogenase
MSQSATRDTVLITGASSGIGKATALYLAQKGFSVIGTSRSAERLAGLKEEASRAAVQVATVELDINDDDAADAVMPRLVSEHGDISVLVNNAGYSLWGPVGSLSIAELRAQFETNFFAAFRLTKAVLPGMVERGRGTVINISSVEGRLATPFSGAYAASKFALEGLSEALRVELWPFGVRVVVVEPGLFTTDLHKNQVIGKDADSPDLPYLPYVERYRERRGRFDRLSSDPIKVARVIHKIIRSKRPAFRYVVGLDASLGILGKRFLPERVFQTLLARATLR